MQWHPNCNYIVTGSSDKTVRLWDVQSGECARLFIGHRSMVLSLAISPDGRFMASGDEDGTIIMWDLSTGRSVLPIMGHNSCVWTLAFRYTLCFWKNVSSLTFPDSFFEMRRWGGSYGRLDMYCVFLEGYDTSLVEVGMHDISFRVVPPYTPEFSFLTNTCTLIMTPLRHQKKYYLFLWRHLYIHEDLFILWEMIKLTANE